MAVEKRGVVPVPVLKRKCLEDEPDGGDRGYKGQRLMSDAVALCCHQMVPLHGLCALRFKAKGFKDGKMLTARLLSAKSVARRENLSAV